jgi:hypothetical protein
MIYISIWRQRNLNDISDTVHVPSDSLNLKTEMDKVYSADAGSSGCI